MGENQNIIIMNFSGAYEDQAFYRGFETVWMDFKDIQGTNCYCDEDAENAIKRRIKELGPSGLHFLDSGNYHYVSKIWLDKIEEDFDLLVFDHHTDMQMPMFGDILSCGGWVRAALDGNPRLNRVCLAGPPCITGQDGGKTRDNGWEEVSALYGEHLVGIREDELTEPVQVREYLEGPALPLYISFDKDILNHSDALTNWDQGQVRLADVLAVIEEISSCRRIIGMDVCGEDTKDSDKGGFGSIEINDRTNREIICKLLECEILSV